MGLQPRAHERGKGLLRRGIRSGLGLQAVSAIAPPRQGHEVLPPVRHHRRRHRRLGACRLHLGPAHGDARGGVHLRGVAGAKGCGLGLRGVGWG